MDDLFRPWMARWSLTADGDAFESRQGARLAPVRYAGRPAMLKLATDPDEQRGAALLEWWGGRGAVRVLRRDGEALLMERLEGDGALALLSASGQDEAATTILCEVIGALHAPRADPRPPSLAPLDRWFGALGTAAGQGGVFAEAAALAEALLKDPPPAIPLHGDIHHGNVLRTASAEWAAIDPKGLIGEAAFDYANLFRNPETQAALAPGRLAARAAVVCRLSGLERGRLLHWVAAYAALGAAWSLESGDPRGARCSLDVAEAALALVA